MTHIDTSATFAIIERDYQLGTAAQIKRIFNVDLASADSARTATR